MQTARAEPHGLAGSPSERRDGLPRAPWVRRVYGAAFDRDTERYLPEAGLETLETRFLYKDIIKLIVARPARGGRKPVVPASHSA